MLKDVIQVCTDGSRLSEKAVDEAVALAKAFGLPLVGMTAVVSKGGRGAAAAEDPEVKARLAAVAEKARAAGVECELVAESCQAPYIGILGVAQDHEARFIVMASRGLGSLGSLFLGSETQKVLSMADRPVLVIR